MQRPRTTLDQYAAISSAILFVEAILDPVDFLIAASKYCHQAYALRRIFRRPSRSSPSRRGLRRRLADRDYTMIPEQDHFRYFAMPAFKILHILPDSYSQRKSRILVRDQQRHRPATNDFIRKAPFFRERSTQTRTKDLIDRNRVRVTDIIDPGNRQQIGVEKGFHRRL